MMAGFGNFDPATEKKLEYHPDLPAFACQWTYREEKQSNQSQRAEGNWVIIAFY